MDDRHPTKRQAKNETPRMTGAFRYCSGRSPYEFAVAVPSLRVLAMRSESPNRAEAEEIDLGVGARALPLQTHAKVAHDVVLSAETEHDASVAVTRIGFETGKAQPDEKRELRRHREHAEGRDFEAGYLDAALVVEHSIRELGRDIPMELIASE